MDAASGIASLANTVLYSEDLQTPAKPSYDYERFKQQTGLPTGSPADPGDDQGANSPPSITTAPTNKRLVGILEDSITQTPLDEWLQSSSRESIHERLARLASPTASPLPQDEEVPPGVQSIDIDRYFVDTQAPGQTGDYHKEHSDSVLKVLTQDEMQTVEKLTKKMDVVAAEVALREAKVNVAKGESFSK